MPANIHGAETQLQASVLRILSGGDNDIVMKLIYKLSAELRTIITGFEQRDGRLPTADEIIWIIGEHHKVDPRYVDRLLADHVDFEEIQTIKVSIEEHTPEGTTR
jgi:vesicle coat complex subunit